MKLKSTLAFLTGIILSSSAFAQLNGTYNIPGSFASLAGAISFLNSAGVSGPVVINISGGYTETAPAGGFILGSTTLNATLSATSTLTIQKTGVAANPLFTAGTGVSTSSDAIFKIAGADYVTLNSLDFHESAANTTPTTATEYGIALVNLNAAAPFDGCNHDVINACNVTLNNAIITIERGIFTAHETPAGAVVTITATSDTHSNNTFTGNTVTNCVNGIQLAGYAAPTPYTLYDQNNRVGGPAATDGNSVSNFGVNFSGTAGITATNQNSIVVSNNNVNQTANGGAGSVSSVTGINLSGINSTITASSNFINVSTAALTTAYNLYGLSCLTAGTTLTANDNKISTHETGGSPIANRGLYFTGTLSNLTAMRNRITQTNNVGSATASNGTYGIINGATGTSMVSQDTVTQVNTVGGNAQYYSILHTATSAVSETVQNCVFLNSSVISSGTNGYMDLIYTQNATPIKSITGNSVSGTISHTTTSAALAAFTIAVDFEQSAAGSATPAVISNNNFSNISSPDISFFGILFDNFGNFTAQNVNVTNNTISNITGATAAIYGIYIYAGNTANVSGNTIANLSNSGNGEVDGIYADSLTVTDNIYNNKIYGLNSSGGFVSGMTTYNPATANISNNLIGNLTNPTANSALPSIAGIYVSGNGGNSNNNIYYNSIYLNATSSGTDFTSGGVLVNSQASATANKLDLRDNIIVNNSTPNGAGYTAALAFAGGGFNNYDPVSNNNLFYSGATTGNHYIFYDGVTGYQSLAAAKVAVAPRESNSVTENPSFASTTGSSPLFLHFAAGTPTAAESAGVNIAGYTTDYDGDVRQGNPGYAGTGTAPDLGADENELTSTVLAVKLFSFSGVNKGSVNLLSWSTATEAAGDQFQLQRSADGISFSSIAIIQANGSASTYSFADSKTLAGRNYYRLLSVSADGRQSLSNIVLLNTGDKPLISVWPNPVADVLNISLPKITGISTISFIDATGRKIFSATVTGNTFTRNISYLPGGTYILDVHSGNEHYTETIIKK